MDLVPLTESAYQFRGGSNAGLIVDDGRGRWWTPAWIRDTAKKILRHIESLKITLAAVVITHADADHCGGAAMIGLGRACRCTRPALEADVVANPIWEPLYLFSGALPPAELRHKFTLAAGPSGGTGDGELGIQELAVCR